MRAVFALGAAMLAFLAVAPAASGHGILRREGDVLRYTAPDPMVGATLSVTSPEPGTIEFFDTTSPGGMDWGPCIPVNERKSRCPDKGVARVEIEVFDGDDSVAVNVATPVEVRGGAGADRISGGFGADEIAGGSGNDSLSGGLGADAVSGAEGDDSIDVRDGVADVYSCGEGADAVTADPADGADPLDLAGCEAPDVAPAAADTTPPAIEVGAKSTRPSRSGALPIPVSLDEPGTIELAGEVLIGGDDAGALRPVSAAPDAPGQVWTLRPGLSKSLSKKLERALARGKRVDARPGHRRGRLVEERGRGTEAGPGEASMKSRAACVAIAVLGTALLLPGASSAHPGHAVAQVDVGQNRFEPAEIEIFVGDGINWVFRGPDTNHSITADPDQIETFDSDPGNPAPLHAIDDTYYHDFYGLGTYTYHCKVHPEMRGTIRVRNPQPPALYSAKVKPAELCNGRGCPDPKLKVKVDQTANVVGAIERKDKNWQEVREVGPTLVEAGKNTLPLDIKGLSPGKYRAVVRATDEFSLASERQKAEFVIRNR